MNSAGNENIKKSNPKQDPKLKQFLEFFEAEEEDFLLNASDEFFKSLPAADLHTHGGALANIALATARSKKLQNPKNQPASSTNCQAWLPET